MQFLYVFVALFALALARPNEVQILKSESDVEPDRYNFIVETSDGKTHHEEGVLKHVDHAHEAIVVHGSYSWVDEKTGHTFTVHYVADENGFQPTADHLPINLRVPKH